MKLGRRDLIEYLKNRPRGFQEKLAEKLGISVVHMSNVKTGKSNFSTGVMILLEKISNNKCPAGNWLKDA